VDGKEEHPRRRTYSYSSHLVASTFYLQKSVDGKEEQVTSSHPPRRVNKGVFFYNFY
jgi:hypothetical protein